MIGVGDDGSRKLGASKLRLSIFEASNLGLRLEIGQGYSGLRVIHAEPDGVAAKSGILPGDFIEEIDSDSLKDPTVIVEQILAATADKKEVSLVVVTPPKRRRMLVLDLERRSGKVVWMRDE
jgi:C-terminal processing protease CtpA/Prc